MQDEKQLTKNEKIALLMHMANGTKFVILEHNNKPFATNMW